jgi:hypothetical protein
MAWVPAFNFPGCRISSPIDLSSLAEKASSYTTNTENLAVSPIGLLCRKLAATHIRPQHAFRAAGLWPQPSMVIMAMVGLSFGSYPEFPDN